MTKELIPIPRISLKLDIEPPTIQVKVITPGEAVELVRSRVGENDLNHKDSVWLIPLSIKKEVLGLAELPSTEEFLGKIQFKRAMQLALLSNAKNITIVYSRPNADVRPTQAETRMVKRVREIMLHMGIILSYVIIIDTETYFSVGT